MTSNTDFIDVYFVGNPSGKFSSYPGGLDSATFDSNISENQPHFYKIKSEKSIACYILFNLSPQQKTPIVKEDQYFGIIIELHGQKLNFKGQQKIKQFLEKCVNDIRFQSDIFERSTKGIYQIKKFKEVEKYLQPTIEKIREEFKEKFKSYLFIIPNSQKNTHSYEKSLKTKILFLKISRGFVMSILIFFSIYMGIEFFCINILSANATMQLLFYISYIILGSYIFITLHKLSKSKRKRKNKFIVISTLIGLLIGIFASQRHVISQSNSWQESLVYSIKPFKLELNNNIKSTDILLCIDVSGSSDENIIAKKSIPKWFYEVKKNKKLFTKLKLNDSIVNSLINETVTEFDLIKLKALKIVYESSENIRLITFGDSPLEILLPTYKDNPKKRKQEISKAIISLKNKKLNTDFNNLFEEIYDITTDDQQRHPDSYSILILSDFIKDVKNDFSISGKLLDSFNLITQTEVEIIFNFLFFETKLTDDNRQFYHNNKDSNKENCLYCALQKDLNSKEDIIYKKIDRNDYELNIITHRIKENELNFYYSDDKNYKSSSSLSIHSKYYSDFNLWITQNTLYRSGKFKLKYKNKKIPMSFKNFYPSKNNIQKVQSNREIELEHESESPSINNKRDLYLYVENTKNNTIHVSKIVFVKKVDNTIVKFIFSIIGCIFFLSLYYFISEILIYIPLPLK